MANRYESSYIVSNAKKIESDGTEKYIRRLSSVFYPNFEKTEDVRILSQEGDRLDILAQEYYNDASLWFVIAKVNNLGKGSLDIPAGKIVRIPYYQEDAGILTLLDNYNTWR
jgi:hypothetical protein